jgi:hypothetical protein
MLIVHVLHRAAQMQRRRSRCYARPSDCGPQASMTRSFRDRNAHGSSDNGEGTRLQSPALRLHKQKGEVAVALRLIM